MWYGQDCTLRAGRCICHALFALEEMDGEEGAGRVITALQELSGMFLGQKGGNHCQQPLVAVATWLSDSPARGEPKPPTSSCGVGSGPAHTAPAEAALRGVP